MSSEVVEIVSRSVAQTLEIGRGLGSRFEGGEVVGLVGTLGTGKTHLIKGMASGLGFEEGDPVTSPTFTLINEYAGRLKLYHIDAYRLEGPEQLEALGFDEICQVGGVVVVEWADRVDKLVADYRPIMIYLEHRGENERFLRFENLSNVFAGLW